LRERLVEFGFEVKPDRLPTVGGCYREIRRAQRERFDELGRCDGCLVLRADPTEDIAPIIEICETNRACIEATGKYLPHAILDLSAAEIPSDLEIEVLRGRGPGWVQDVRAWVDRAHAATSVELEP
jgi:hypothetical protein